MSAKTLLRITVAFLLVILLVAPASARRALPKGYEKAVTEEVVDTGPRPIVATYFYYWYDYPSRGHILNAPGTDALIRKPVKFDGTFSYENDYWHLGELRDMVEAGIDIVLPVYQGHGEHPECEPWSATGLEHMVKALNHLKSQGEGYPLVGMFYDTQTLMYNSETGFDEKYKTDLTSESGLETFYKTVESFFDLIPVEFRATIDDKPVVWLYKSDYASEYGEDFFNRFKAKFASGYGVEPYIVAERSWSDAKDADAWYLWGAAEEGSLAGTGVVAVGPGYDNSAINERSPDVVERMDGLLYEWGWLAALDADPRIVVVETWNNLHEGTEVCQTRENGGKYIELTRYYADVLKLPSSSRGELTDELLSLFFNTVTLEPAEVWPIDLELGYVEFPVRVHTDLYNIFGHLEWVDPGTGVVIDPADDDFTLNAKETLRLDYFIRNLEEKTLTGPLPYFTGSFAAGGWDMPINVRLYPKLVRRMESYIARKPISVDGDLSDWAGRQATIIADVSHAGGPVVKKPFDNTGAGYPGWHPADASMEIYTCRDNDYFYVAVVTRDDAPMDGIKGDEILDGDCIQLAFEMDDDRDGSLDTSGDMEFALTEIAGADRFYTFHRPYGLQGPLDRLLRHAIERQGNNTIYEFSIPVAEFNIDGSLWEEGYTIGMNVVMHDDDGSGYEGFIRLAPGLNYDTDTSRFARVVILETPPE